MENTNQSQITNIDFGPLLPYINDINVTDINWNGRQLWIDDIMKGRYLTDITLSEEYVVKFTQQIMNAVNKSFNSYTQLLEAEIGDIRISVIHETAAASGRSISIRKSPAIRRLTEEGMINDNYATKEVLDLIKLFVKGMCNIVVCGLPGVGKTELVKWMTSFIADDQRVITIEDNLEVHYPLINPQKDSVELKVVLEKEEGRLTYTDAIKAALRHYANWILFSEVRGRETKVLLEALSTGCHLMTTMHTDDVRNMPNRIKNMVGDTYDELDNEIYENIDVAILIKKKTENGKIKRYISQMAVYSRTLEGENIVTMVVDNSRIVTPIEQLPQYILNKIDVNNNSTNYEEV